MLLSRGRFILVLSEVITLHLGLKSRIEGTREYVKQRGKKNEILSWRGDQREHQERADISS